MTDPHNFTRPGEIWNPHKLAVRMREIEALREYGALSGGWAWHYLSPPHKEEKHLHEHRDIDFHVLSERFDELVIAFGNRGYHRKAVRFDDPSGDLIQFEQYIFPCPECQGHGEYYDSFYDEEGTESMEYKCPDCEHWFPEPKLVNVLFNVFVHQVGTLEVNGYTMLEPSLLLALDGVKDSSEECLARVAARGIQANDGVLVGNPLLVGTSLLG